MSQTSPSSRTLQAVVALQALTLVAVLAGQPTTPAADAFERDRARNMPALPNAAAQRQEMIRLLEAGVAASEAATSETARQVQALDKRLEGIAATLERVERKLPEPDPQAAPAQANARRLR